jgi:hypothetical protein
MVENDLLRWDGGVATGPSDDILVLALLTVGEALKDMVDECNGSAKRLFEAESLRNSLLEDHEVRAELDFCIEKAFCD